MKNTLTKLTLIIAILSVTMSSSFAQSSRWNDHVQRTQDLRQCRGKTIEQMGQYTLGTFQVMGTVITSSILASLTFGMVTTPGLQILGAVTSTATATSAAITLDGLARVVTTDLGACPGAIALDDLVILVSQSKKDFTNTIKKSNIAKVVKYLILANRIAIIASLKAMQPFGTFSELLKVSRER
jgi:hypothetical protein